MYRAARVVVIPLKDVEMSAGQTVLLETLPFRCIVEVTDVIATRDYLRHGLNAIAIAAGDVNAMADAIRAVLATPDCYRPMRQEAARDVRSRFSMTRYAHDLSGIVDAILRRRREAKSFHLKSPAA